MKWITLAITSLMLAISSAQAESPLKNQELIVSEKIILGGGCFWCLEHDLQETKGVTSAISGYSGGERPNPTYENSHIVTEEFPTSHVEVVETTYDPEILPLEELLQYYFRHIDATDGGGQFYDRGPQYRPVVFVENEEQRKVAERVKAESEKTLGQPLAVEILPAKTFYAAEEYHQDYAEKNPLRYKAYRLGSGRDRVIDAMWDKE